MVTDTTLPGWPPGSRWTAVGAVLWLVQPLVIVAELVTVTRVTAPYSLLDNTISDAGAVTCTSVRYAWGLVAVCSPSAWLLNAATVASGLALAGGAVLLCRSLPGRRVRIGVTVAAIVSGLSQAGVGLAPVDVHATVHVLVALPQFVSFALLLLLLAALLRVVSPAAALTALVAGVLCLAGTVALTVRLGEPQGFGLLERVAVWPLFLALVPVGLVLLRRGPRRRAAPAAA